MSRTVSSAKVAALATYVGLFAVACDELPDSFQCKTAEQCIADSTRTAADTRCESTHYCSVADTSCGSGGYRYHAAAPPYGESCVGLPDLGAMDGGDMAGGSVDTFSNPCADSPGAYFCEGFENGLESFWIPFDGTDPIAIDTLQARSGTHALHVHLPPMASFTDAIGGTIENIAPFPKFPMTGEFWVSAHYFFADTIPNGSFLFILQQWTAPSYYFNASVGNGKAELDTNLFGGTGAISPSTAMPVGTWACVTLHVTRGASGSTHYLIDGVDTGATIDGDLSFTPSFERLRLGYLLYNPPTPGADIWIDDIRIDLSPYTCTH